MDASQIMESSMAGEDPVEEREAPRRNYSMDSRTSYPTTRSLGHCGAAPSSLAGLAKGKKYFIDPYTPFTPRPATLLTRDMMIGPPLATYRSNHWITQTSPAYIPRRLQNHRIPRTPPEIKRGFPAKEAPRPATEQGKPRFMVDANGHLVAKFRKPGRAAFPMCDEVGAASWTFKKMGFV
mmetsp:Transcript_72141/g.105732  ORF Transcript_72141/g.105732 Transcript_72141/m.105732 type:complete len:180 (+) Transcript_72141:44-583(+)